MELLVTTGSARRQRDHTDCSGLRRGLEWLLVFKSEQERVKIRGRFQAITRNISIWIELVISQQMKHNKIRANITENLWCRHKDGSTAGDRVSPWTYTIFSPIWAQFGEDRTHNNGDVTEILTKTATTWPLMANPGVSIYWKSTSCQKDRAQFLCRSADAKDQQLWWTQWLTIQ